MTLYILCGLAFAGKSTLSRKIVEQKGWKLIAFDTLWVETEKTQLVPQGAEGWRLVRDLAQKEILATLKSGISVVYDDNNPKKDHREELRVVARKAGAVSAVVYLDTPIDVIRAREEASRTLQDRHDVDPKNFEKVLKDLEPPTSDENVFTFRPQDDVTDFVNKLDYMTKGRYKHRKYTVEPYTSKRKQAFEGEAEQLHSLFGDKAILIEHIGSTAVPNLAGKPTIDMLVTVKNIEIADELTGQLEGVGYIAFGDYIGQGSRLFAREEDNARLVNVHVFETSSSKVSSMIGLRDYFRSHPKVVAEYSKLKLDLFTKYPNDYATYRKHKDEWMEALKQSISEQSPE